MSTSSNERLPGSRKKFGSLNVTSRSRIGSGPMSACRTVGASPTPVVALHCGSRSTRRTCEPLRAKAAAKLMAVVVFPTPPFWLATHRIRPTAFASLQTHPSRNFRRRDIGRMDNCFTRGVTGDCNRPCGDSGTAIFARFHVQQLQKLDKLHKTPVSRETS